METVLLAALTPLAYLIGAMLTGRWLYRADWGDEDDEAFSDVAFFAFVGALLWPVAVLIIAGVLFATMPSRAEREAIRRKRKEDEATRRRVAIYNAEQQAAEAERQMRKALGD